MKKNKTVAFMLAATLLVGGTFLGTKAYLTDEAKASNNLILSMGNVDLETEELNDGRWMIEHKDGEIEAVQLTPNAAFNVRPGDKFIKQIEIFNKSSLDTELEITGGNAKENTDIAKAIEDGFITLDNNAQDVIKELNNNETSKVDGYEFDHNKKVKSTLEIRVTINNRTPEEDNKYNKEDILHSKNNENILQFNFLKDINPFVIEAKQEN